ncbi:hypothetical protein FHG87_014515 [Trinorchestia longiramus]|nr:hypothetical protein FHG87_014515 [Trinorchestia longiramus]
MYNFSRLDYVSQVDWQVINEYFLLFYSKEVACQLRRNGLLKPVAGEQPSQPLLESQPDNDRQPVAIRPLLQPTKENNHGKSQDNQNDFQKKSGQLEATRTGSDLFGMVRATTPTPSPVRPTNNIKSGLLNPAVPDSPKSNPPSRRPIVKRPTRRPSQLIAKTQSRPTRRPTDLLTRPTRRSSTTQMQRTTRRPTSLFSSSRRRMQPTSTTTSAPQLESYRSEACPASVSSTMLSILASVAASTLVRYTSSPVNTGFTSRI